MATIEWMTATTHPLVGHTVIELCDEHIEKVEKRKRERERERAGDTIVNEWIVKRITLTRAEGKLAVLPGNGNQSPPI